MTNGKKAIKSFGKKLGIGLTHEEKKLRSQREIDRLEREKERAELRKKIYEEKKAIRKIQQRPRPAVRRATSTTRTSTPLSSFVGQSDINFSQAVFNSSVGSTKKKKKGKKSKDIMSEIMRM